MCIFPTSESNNRQDLRLAAKLAISCHDLVAPRCASGLWISMGRRLFAEDFRKFFGCLDCFTFCMHHLLRRHLLLELPRTWKKHYLILHQQKSVHLPKHQKVGLSDLTLCQKQTIGCWKDTIVLRSTNAASQLATWWDCKFTKAVLIQCLAETELFLRQFHNPENLKCSFRRCSIMYPKKSVCHIRRSFGIISDWICCRIHWKGI